MPETATRLPAAPPALNDTPAASAAGGPSLVVRPAPAGRFLLWLGRHPYIALALVVHLVAFVAVYSLVLDDQRQQDDRDVIEIAIGMESSIDDNTETEPEAAGGGALSQVVQQLNVPGRSSDADSATNNAARATSVEVTDWPEPTETGRATVRATQASQSLGSMLAGNGVQGSGNSGSGSPGGGYSMRGEAGRATGVHKNGGTAASEAAVDAGLLWLERHQHIADVYTPGDQTIARFGWWRGADFPDDARDLATNEETSYPGSRPHGEVASTRDYDVGLTGLCLLAFLGAGNTPDSGPYATTVSRTVRWLVREQNRHGEIGPRNMYNHAIATLALAECAIMSRDPSLLPVVQRAVDFMLALQNPHGGWDYRPRSITLRNDTSITSWCLMALKAAKSAGADVPRTAFIRMIHYFRRMIAEDGYTYYADLREDDFRRGAAMVATSLFCLQLLGADPDDPILARQEQILLANQPDRERRDTLDSSYYAWYVGTLAMFFRGGDGWSQWNATMRETCVGTQRAHGQRRGSWDGVDKWSWAGGRVYATAINVLALEIYYRYIPDFLIADGRTLQPFHDERRRYMVIDRHLADEPLEPRSD